MPSVAQKVEQFFAQYQIRTFESGNILIFPDDQVQSVYYIIEGRIRQYDIAPNGDEIVLNVFKEPAFFPLSFAINGGTSAYFYEAEVATKVRVAPGSAVLQFLKDNPDVMLDLLSRLYRGMDGVIGRMAHLMSGSATNRLAYELLVEAKRFGKERGDTYHLSLSQAEIGARAGLSRETVSREIHKLKAEGLVAVEKDGIVVQNLRALEEKLRQG